jgi:hypothetical protein
MTMNIPPAAAGYAAAMRKEVRDFTDDTRVADSLSKAKIGIRVVTRSLKDLTEDNYLDPSRDNSKATVWRFLAQNQDGEVYAAEVSSADGAPHLVSISRDSRIGAALRAVRGLDHFKALPDDNYDVSLLRVSGVLMEAIWLRSTTTGKQYVMPILSGPKELRLGTLYDEQQLRPIVQALVERFRNTDTPRFDPTQGLTSF